MTFPDLTLEGSAGSRAAAAVRRLFTLAGQHRLRVFVATVCVTAALTVGVSLPLALQLDVEPWLVALVLALFCAADVPLLNLRFGHNQESFTVAEMCVLLALFLVPTPVVLVLAATGVLVFHAPRNVPLMKRLFNPSSFVVGLLVAVTVARVVAGPHAAELSGRQLGGLAAGTLAFTVWNGAAVARVVSLSQGIGWSEVWRRGLLMRMLVALGNTGLGTVFVVLVQWDPQILMILPPLMAAMFAVYRAYLQAMQERDVWQQLESAGRELNRLDEEEVCSSVVRRAAQLLNADRVDLVLQSAHAEGAATTWSGDADGARRGLRPASAEELGADRFDGEMVHTVALEGVQGRLGVLRVAFHGPVSLTKRERHVLQTFCHSVGTTLENLRLYSEMREHAEAKAHEAAHDSLTGLGNRSLLHARVPAAFARTTADQQCALLIVDLDHFKEINDTLGHAAGDVFLTQVAGRLARALPQADAVCRLGGDEFAILLGGLPGGAVAADAVAERLLDVLAEPVVFDGLRLSIEGSVGVACYPQDAGSFDELLQRADIALYQAKESRGSYSHYSADRDASSVDRLTLAAELRTALRSDELVVHFQPQYDLATGEVMAAEALVRWQHPRRGLLAPAEFITAVEHSGLVRDFTLAVLDKAVAECATWQSAGRRVAIAVNLSARNLLDRQLPVDVRGVLQRHGVPPEQLVLEITETTMMSELDVVESVLGQLRSMGVQLSVDDFGTGFSSLAFLQRVAVNEVKIDRSFVTGMLDSDSDHALVRATVQLAHSLGARAVAEGVENAALATALRTLGCDYAQGFHLGRPVAAIDLRDVILDRTAPAVAVVPDPRRLRAVEDRSVPEAIVAARR